MRKFLLTARSTRSLSLFSCGLAAFLAACSNGGSGGGGGTPATVLAEVEPNETTATALSLTLGRPASGDVVTAGDLDLWRIDLAGGEIVKFELEATRIDQDVWDAASNTARITVLDSDGTTKLLEHDLSGNFSDGWSWGDHDLDIPAFRAPADGTYYVQIAQDNVAAAGGKYALTASLVDLGSQQVEAEPVAISGVNDTVATAETITPGIVRGFHVDGESDFYSFTITGPTVVEFEMLAYRNGVYAGDDAYYDTEIELMDSDGVTVLRNDDDTYFYDSGLLHYLDAAGTYSLRVTECCGAGDAGYFLRFGTTSFASATAEVEPNENSGTANAIAYGASVAGSTSAGDTDFFSFTGTAGDVVHLQRFDSSNGRGFVDNVTFELLAADGTTPLSVDSGGGLFTTRTILTVSGTFFVRVVPDASPTSTNWAFRLTRFEQAGFESEANDTAITADSFDANGRAAGTVDPAADLDVFAFTATQGHLVTFSVYASAGSESDGFGDLSGHGSTLDPLVIVRDELGAVVAKSGGTLVNINAESITDGLATLAVSFVAPSTGNFTVEVTDSAAAGAPTNTYVIMKR
ncbi:MAG: hypothetical protein IPJ77_19535 [Planctomycetes bacterium]|nr:hypothetical protein [Planctomycetota bacterium]